MSGGALSEMDTEENPAKFYHLDETDFPIVLKAANNERHEIGSWQELTEFLQERPAGVKLLEHFRRYKAEGHKDPILFSSMVSPLVIPYIAAFTQATAKYQRGFLFPGDFQDQPNVLVQAFALIEGEIARLEQAQIKTARRNQKEAAARG